ncbi:hypothetical protein AALO_G00039250 [Alosa alosa]|uniref:Uncharacterized protein n=1 Tax=Alosa alosa TaxID=278164 RepID=A0AAV6H7W0_9TELE|nr:hypothetical protein AALO_G00039250 [Alosa alosa]
MFDFDCFCFNSQAFHAVQENSDTFWKFERYELIKEFHSRPAPPPPFILLSHLYLLLRRFIMCCHPQGRKQLSETEEEDLMSREGFMKDKYLATQHPERSESMEHRMVQLEEQVSQSAKALQWMIYTLKAQGYQSKEEPPSMSRSTESKRDEDEIDGDPERRQYHFHAQRSLCRGAGDIFKVKGTKL